LSISKSCMRRWTWATIIRMNSRTSMGGMLLLRRTKRPRKGQFRPKLSGCKFLEHGWKEFVFYIRIVSRSSKNIRRLSWNCFVQF
jgi:hypothetical protein